VPDEEQRRRFTEICAGEKWILDTAYGKWVDIPLERVELIIGLDYPGWLSFGRLLRRTLHRALTKTPVCNGNQESLRLMLSRDSILLWHLKSFRRKRERMRKWLAEGRNIKLVRDPMEAELLLALIAAQVNGKIGTAL
jgi:adenylate kinase family enzyme